MNLLTRRKVHSTTFSFGKISRRALFAAALLPLLAGCVATDQAALPGATPAPVTTSRTSEFAALENEFGARLGVWAFDTGQQRLLEYQADERFAFCSTVKAFLAAGVLSKRTLQEMDEVVKYSQADILDVPSPITEKNVATGMTWRQLAEAAVRFSDSTAANLLFQDLGGPAGAQKFLRAIGDQTTDVSRIEPDLTSAIPGDRRDTSTPRTWGENLRSVILGDVLPAEKRDILTDWLVSNTTGAGRIRAGVPVEWKVGDKTGSGDYGTCNDIAVIWPPGRAPIVVAILTSRPGKDDRYTLNNDLIARATAITLDALR